MKYCLLGGLALTLVCIASDMCRAADITMFALYKRQVYVQTNAGPPGPRCSPYMFDAVVELAGSNSIHSAALATPVGSQTALAITETREFLPQRWLSWTCGSYSSAEELESAWPAGRYTFFVIGRQDTVSNPSLTLAGNGYPAQPPRVQNFDAAQAVDAGRDFTLLWDPLADGTTNDVVFVSVRRASDQAAVFNTPFLKGQGTLDGTATSLLIPAGTLESDVEYDVYVRFDKVIERSAEIRGVLGQASYASGTHLRLKTSAVPGS